MTDDTIESLRAKLAEVERERDEALATMAASNANALRAQHDATDGDARWVREQARIAKERDAALAACAEMRAALQAALDDVHTPFGVVRLAYSALARTDLGRGMVVVAGPLDALVDNLVRVVCDCHDGSDLWAHTRRDPEAFRRAVRDALLKKGGG